MDFDKSEKAKIWGRENGGKGSLESGELKVLDPDMLML